jgi:hypothetical protein
MKAVCGCGNEVRSVQGGAPRRSEAHCPLGLWGASLSRLDHFGCHAEGAAGCRERVPTAAAAQVPAGSPAQCGQAVLDLRQSTVRWLAQFASCEARDRPEVASTALACLLVLAIKSAAPKEWWTADPYRLL